jgi:hypothetical protein
MARAPGTLGSILLASLLVGLTPRPAAADAGAELRYTRTQIFSGALRYLRIDLGYEITEKDSDAAYLLFRYVPQGTKEPMFGAIEIVETSSAVRLSVKLPKLPSYHETVIRDGLVKKLRADYGNELPPKAPKENKELPPKSGADDEGDTEKSPKSKKKATKDEATD